MRRKKINNFAAWREEAIRTGRIRIHFPPLPRNGDLAELIGVILGDGHIQKFPRTERLLIFSNSNNSGFIARYTRLVEEIFDKKLYVYQQTDQNCTRISLYEKNISLRLGISTGARKDCDIKVPSWILKSRSNSIRYLRGLYEAEGSHSVHAPTYTYKLEFSNRNQSLLKNVAKLLTVLGFSPHSDPKRVQISRKDQVASAIELLGFRKYSVCCQII